LPGDRRDTQTYGESNDLISLLTNIKEGYTDRQQGDLISLLLFFRDKEIISKNGITRVSFAIERAVSSGNISDL
jgi:hypothetical protein